MHEVSIMQSVFEIAFDKLRQEQATRIHRIRLRIGALSGVVPEALQFAFDALKEDTPAANAVLDVEFLPVRFHCATCCQEFGGDDVAGLCPMCGQPSATVRQGRELDVVSLELSREE
jgi:hydrogenase nickel incorporation protein HypA/HybF